jgi:flagellar operon protein
MLDKVNIGEGQPVGQVQPSHQPVAPSKRAPESFEAVIKREIEKLKGVKFSAHALERLTARNIRLSADDVKKVVEAMNRAQAKGAKDSLVLVRGAALVVSVKNRTVVTVLDREEMRGNVFTNIDSAVVMDGDEHEA